MPDPTVKTTVASGGVSQAKYNALCLINDNGYTTEVTVHTSCYCVSDLLRANIVLLKFMKYWLFVRISLEGK